MATKTKAERLAEIDAKIAKLQEQRANVVQEPEVDLSSLVGTEVAYKFGRGENRKVYHGTVIAVSGDRLKITTGSGFDVVLHTIASSDLVSENQALDDDKNKPEAANFVATPAEQVEQSAVQEAAVNTADEAALKALGLA